MSSEATDAARFGPLDPRNNKLMDNLLIPALGGKFCVRFMAEDSPRLVLCTELTKLVENAELIKILAAPALADFINEVYEVVPPEETPLNSDSVWETLTPKFIDIESDLDNEIVISVGYSHPWDEHQDIYINVRSGNFSDVNYV